MKETTPNFKLEELDLPEGFQVLRPPGVELFLAGSGEEVDLPADLAKNPELCRQAGERRELYKAFRHLFERIEVGMDIKEALDRRVVDPQELAVTYQKLADFIESDENNTRLILYFPFELLPDMTECRFHHSDSGFQPSTIRGVHAHTSEVSLPLSPYGQEGGLIAVSERLRDIYKNAWIRLLFESEVRASFVDGDVLEPGMGEPPRVRKAGHLIPEILQRGLIDTSDIIELLEISEDEELLQSLTEGVVVAGDRELISEDDWQRIKKIAELKPAVGKVLDASQDIVASIDLQSRRHTGGDPKRAKRVEGLPRCVEYVGLESLANHLEADLAEIERMYVPDSSYTATISHKRAVWEKQVRREKIIDHLAKQLATRLQNGDIGLEDIELFCEREGFDSGFAVAGLRSITIAGEALAFSNIPKAHEFANQGQPLFQKFWGSESDAVKDEIISGLSHWARLGLIPEGILKNFRIHLTDLSSLFPVDLGDLYSKDLKEIAEAAKKVEADQYLSQYVYPFFVAFGSRVKGYARSNVDLDLGVFIKPNTPWGEREEIFSKLQQVVPKLGSIDETPEFWLEEKDGRYNFRAVPQKAEGLIAVGAPLVHFLLGGVWFGRGEEIGQIQRDLLGRYLNLDRFGDQKDRIRVHLLRQIEMDVLQYRLIHKGYRWLYPNRRSEGTTHSHLIDWESDFWDPGYRRIASLLFASRVFLPDLKLK